MPPAGVKPALSLRGLLPALLLAAAVVAVYAPVLGNGFISMDDDRYISENPQVRRGLAAETARWALTSTEHANWYPLRRLSHLLDVSVFGMWAGGHHLVSVLWHAAAAALLALALHLMTGRLARGFVVAGLFALHPLQVESVAWASERSNVQAGFFFALTLLLWTRFARRPGAGRYGAALASLSLGLAAKPAIVSLPLLLLLLDVWPLGRMSPPGAPPWRVAVPLFWRRFLEKVPLLLLAAASGAVAVAAHRQVEALATLDSIPLAARLANASLSYARYLGKLLVPAGLAVFYPHPGRHVSYAGAGAAALLLAGLTTLALARSRRRPWLAAGWLWFAGTLLPMSGIVQFGLHAMADRFAYLPMIGVFLALVWLAAERLPGALRQPRVAVPLAGVLFATLAAATISQTRRWKSDLTLYTHTLAVTSDNWMIEPALGNALAREGRFAEALPHLQKAVRLNPADPDVRYDLGNVLYRLDRLREAEAAYRGALRLRPTDADYHHNLGATLAATGRLREAEAAYREALRLRPENQVTHFLLGDVLALQGWTDEAAAQYREVLRLQPDFAAARQKLALLERR